MAISVERKSSRKVKYTRWGFFDSVARKGLTGKLTFELNLMEREEGAI